MMFLVRKLGGLLLGTRAKRIGGGLLISALVAGGGYLYHRITTGNLRTEVCASQAELQQARSDRNQWRALAESGARRVSVLEQERVHAQQAVAKLQAELATRQEVSRVRVQRIRDAPEGDDGPVAPVLRDAIEALP